MEKTRIEVGEMPELETRVTVSGSFKQQEVGGGLGLAVAAGIALGLGRPL